MNSLLDHLSGSEFLTAIEIKHAYFTIPRHSFGLSSVPRVFANVMKPFVWAVRNKGIRLAIYLDDIIIVSSSRDFSAEETTIVNHILASLGFIVKKEKSQLVPSQSPEFPSFVISTVNMVVSSRKED